MKAKRERDRLRDAETDRQAAIEAGEQTDWQAAMAEWEAWEKENSK
jgi:hypothetical protein